MLSKVHLTSDKPSSRATDSLSLLLGKIHSGKEWGIHQFFGKALRDIHVVPQHLNETRIMFHIKRILPRSIHQRSNSEQTIPVQREGPTMTIQSDCLSSSGNFSLCWTAFSAWGLGYPHTCDFHPSCRQPLHPGVRPAGLMSWGVLQDHCLTTTVGPEVSA